MRWKINFSGSDVRQQKPCRKTTTTAPRLLLVFTVLVLFCAAGAGTAAADTVYAGSFQNLSDAISNFSSGERIIVITDDIPVSTTAFPVIGTGKSIKLTPADDSDYRIYRTAAIVSNATGLFTVSDGNLTIADNGTCTLILDGNRSAVTDNDQPLVYIGGDGTFTLAGGTITNNNATYGGGVDNDGGTFTMSGGEITNNYAERDGGGVENYEGTFTMSGGTITNNYARFGGGVDNGGTVYNGGTFTMSDGEITNNNAGDGGGVENNEYGTFTMSGGEITNNYVEYYGGGVENDGIFTMSGGEITNNYAENDGGGVENYGIFTMSGGEITSNTADNVGGGVDNYKSIFTMSGSALVDATNEVYLWDNTFITVALPLTGGAKNITVRNHAVGVKVIELPASASDEYQDNFILSSAMASSYVLEYNDSGPTPIYELAAVPAPAITPTTPPTIPPASGDGGNTQNSFRVLFETNGGSTVSPVTGLSYGDRITAPADPIKEGYTFGGWYRNEACTVAWTFAGDAVPGDITLYAKWISGGAAPTMTVTATQTTTAAGTAAATQTATMTAAATSAESPTAAQTPAPVFGIFAGMVVAGVLIRRRLL